MAVLYHNNQWELLKTILRTRKPEALYEIDISRLTETTERSGVEYYDWLIHMSEKEWVNLHLFIDAFKKALELHAGRYQPPLDQAMLERSIKRAFDDRRD